VAVGLDIDIVLYHEIIIGHVFCWAKERNYYQFIHNTQHKERQGKAAERIGEETTKKS
jgi:hypothetical protein